MSCWSVVPAAEEPGKVALLVGINNYNRRKLEDRPLRFAERDIQELAVELREQQFTVRTLTGANATKVKIEEAPATAGITTRPTWSESPTGLIGTLARILVAFDDS